MRRATAILALLGSASALLIAALAFAPPSGAKTTDATIEHYMFMPDSITVAQGDAIVWTNQDDAPHTVTSQSGPAAFDSGNLAKGQSYSVTFSTPGNYSYYCSIHPDMKGKVTVTPASSSSTPPTTATTAPPSHSGEPPPSQSAAPPPAASTPPEQCESVATASLDPFVVHLDHAHLEESPGQQANDLLNVNQYVKTHTVLLEQMTSPLFGLAEASTYDLQPFVVHLDHAHLEESPGQQANDLLNVNQYVKTHTVLLEQMTAPTTGAATGAC